MEKLYTVEQASDLLAIHPKTIQRYIREGKLRAAKVGKSWRITGHDLSVFIEQNESCEKSHGTDTAGKAVISSVIDVKIDGLEESSRIVNMLMAAGNSKPEEFGKSTMHVQHLESEQKVRITLWGGLLYVQTMLDFISAIIEEPAL